MTNKTEYEVVLQEKGLGSLLGAFVVETEASKEVRKVSSRETAASRKESWKKAIEEFDEERLEGFQEVMLDYLDKVTELVKTAGKGLDEVTSKKLMLEALDNKAIMEFLEARKNMYRKAVFDEISNRLAAEGVEDPEHQNGSIEVPELKKKFAREGAGYKDPSLDHEKLREMLGEEEWKGLVITKIIPEQRVEEFSEERLLELVRRRPEVLEMMRECTVRGKAKSPRFVIRDMK